MGGQTYDGKPTLGGSPWVHDNEVAVDKRGRTCDQDHLNALDKRSA